MAVSGRGKTAGNWRSLDAWAHGEMLSNGDPIAGLADLLGSMLAPDQSVAPRPPAVGVLGRLQRHLESRRARREGSRSIRMNYETHEADEFTDEDADSRVQAWRKLLLS